MKIIYDSKGEIFIRYESSKTPVGTLLFSEIEVPEKAILIKMDTSKEPHQPIFEDIPKSEMELLQDAVRELSNKSNDGSFNSPIVWVDGMIAKLNLYYTCGGKKYQCIEDSVIGLWGEPQYLARYFKEVK